MSIIKIESEKEFNDLISANKTSIVLFSADWAEQCTQILDVMSKLIVQPQFKEFQFLNVPAEAFSQISIAHQVTAVPTVIFLRKASAIHRIDGVDIAALTKKCTELSGSSSSPVQNGDASNETLVNRLKALITKSKIVIFMKGDRTTPRCGFSKQLISIMNDTGVDYETFDILTDEEVRQGLKTYSDWPTYPQVYVNGELIGGLDIIKELLSGNELKSTLDG